MSKTKMRCNSCGKWFQSANAKEVTCPDCAQKARKEKMAAKNTPPSAHKPAGTATNSTARSSVPPPRPKTAQTSGPSWLDKLDDVKVSTPEPPPARPKIPSSPPQRETRESPSMFRGAPGPNGPPREDRGPGQGHERGERGERYGYERGPGPGGPSRVPGPGVYRFGGNPGAGLTSPPGQRPRPPYDGGGRGPGGYRPGPGGPGGRPQGPGGFKGGPRGKGRPHSAPKPQLPPKPPREKTPPPPPFVPTDEQIKQVEERYLELSQPTEFDGIRTQIAKETSIPKKAVKKIVKDLRSRKNIPSWWEMQVYKGSEEELARIKTAYLPHLPVPPVGVHKTLAEQLELKPGIVYQAIKTIRQELNLPQYNDPGLHGDELINQANGKENAEAQTPADSHPNEQVPVAIQHSEPAQTEQGTPVSTTEATSSSEVHAE